MHKLSKKKRKSILRCVILSYLLLVIIVTVVCIVTSAVYATYTNTEVINKSKINNYDTNYNLDIDFLNATKSKISGLSNPVNQSQYQINHQSERQIYAENSYDTSLYSKLTADEIHLIETVVQHEVGNFSPYYKTLIAELIYNRLQSEEFPNDVHEVLYQENQFTNIEYWYTSDYEIDTDTKNVVKQVFIKMKPSHNALYYYNPELSSNEAVMWFEYSGDVEYLFSYSETSWDIEYETRFFK